MRGRARIWLLAATMVPWSATAGASGITTVTGPADIVDGDTLDIGSTRVRLFGVDAPETAQECTDIRGAKWSCGRSAARALEKLTTGQPVTCRGDTKDDYGRLLAVCTTPKGEVNASLVRQGLAWAFVKYSGAYVPVEAEARSARRGVFAVQNEPPWEFRVNGPRNLPSCGLSKFPTLAGLVINRWRDRDLHGSGAARDVWAAQRAAGVGSELWSGCAPGRGRRADAGGSSSPRSGSRLQGAAGDREARWQRRDRRRPRPIRQSRGLRSGSWRRVRSRKGLPRPATKS